MTIAWFIAPMKTKDLSPRKGWVRYCGMNDNTSLILADGGAWSEYVEVLGNVALIKISASDATLATIAAQANFQRIPVGLQLTDLLTSLTTAQRTAILNRLQAMGYTLTEIQTALGSTLAQWRTKTLGQLLRFICTRRLKPLSIDVNGTVTFSSTEVVPTPVDIIAGQI